MLKKITSIILSGAMILSLAQANTSLALDKKVYTITSTAQYENPYTKELEDLKLKPKDLQYKSKKAIGDGMVGAVIGSKALLDNTGKKKYVVIKTGMSDATKDYKIAVKNLKDNNYKDVKFTVVKEDKKNKTKDLKFEVQSDNPSIKLSTHITPMGRSVTFFAQMSDKNAKEGKKEFDSQKVGKKMSTK
jgi:cell wall anchor domain protein